MPTPPLGKLENTELKSGWQFERDFTLWLAEEANLAQLAESPGIDELELEATEKNVGPFRADILCKDTQQALARGDQAGRLPGLAQGERALQVSLGGAERASAQMRTAIDRLNAAYAGGAVTQTRYLQLHDQISRTFTTEAVRARDLRSNLAGLNAQFTTLGHGAALFRNALAGLGVRLSVREVFGYADAFTQAVADAS
jgi:hypothetical protein